jgi:hypothetical protein
MGHGSMGGQGMAGAGHGRAGQSTLDCRKKKDCVAEQAATRRAEGKDVSSARAWPNLRNFGHRRIALQHIGDGFDALGGVGAMTSVVVGATKLVA